MDVSYSTLSAALGLADPSDLNWLIVGAMLAGLVRGFSGFGTAMVFLPFAASVMPPVWAVTTMIMMDLIAPLIMAPKVAKDAELGDVFRLATGCLLGLPLGVAVLLLLPTEAFRYMVSAVTLVLLTLLLLGLRYRGTLTRPMIYGVGGMGGVLGGAVGIPGPPVIMLYLAGPLPASVIRANNFLFLLAADILLIGVFAFQGILFQTPLIIGACLSLIYLVGIFLGSLVFKPSMEKTYRVVAYVIIVISAIRGLPLFG